MASVDERIESLLAEASQVAGLKEDNQSFQEWRSRAEAVVGQKLGENSALFQRLHARTYRYQGVFGLGEPVDHSPYFSADVKEAAGILAAALESDPLERVQASSGTIFNINNSPSATANASAQATINGSAEQLRRLIAEASELNHEERAEAFTAVPDDDDPIDLSTIDKLLSIATRSQTLLTGIAGWIVANMDRLPDF